MPSEKLLFKSIYQRSKPIPAIITDKTVWAKPELEVAAVGIGVGFEVGFEVGLEVSFEVGFEVGFEDGSAIVTDSAFALLKKGPLSVSLNSLKANNAFLLLLSRFAEGP